MKKFRTKILHKMLYDQKSAWDRIALGFLNGCKKILDIGCGEGRFMSQDKDRITGLDWNETSLNKCKLQGCIVTQGDARRLPFADVSVDGIHCSHLIEHFHPPDVHLILSEIDRVLEPKGVLVIRAPLLHYGFYSNLTHIRPYNPEAILHYLTVSQEHTFPVISSAYKVLRLKWRYGCLTSRNKYCNILCNCLYRWGFPWLQKTGFMLVLKKDT